MDVEREGDAFEKCSNCNLRPACGPHLCPLNLETEGCTCCGVCARTCAAIAQHIEEHTPAVVVDPRTGELFVTYMKVDDGAEPDSADQPDEGSGGDRDDGGYGLTA